MSERPIAFLTRPVYVPKPWGGRRLATELARRGLPEGPIGEAWEASDLDEAPTRVDGGALDGARLSEALGRAFPLLAKVIDAREDLSVQVHPDGRDGPAAKEEAWVALGDGGAVAVGLNADASGPGAAPRPWLDRLERARLTGASNAPSRPPTLVHVPAGTVHAILAGSLVWEVQTPVDVTWRLDDYGRMGLDGRPRALHRSEAAGVLARGPEAPSGVEPGGLKLRGRRFGMTLLPPGTHQGLKACLAFLPAGGRFSGAGAASGFDVPAARTVVLTPRATAVTSPGWVFLAQAPA